MLTRDQILTARAPKAETVAVPEWGGDVTIRAMTGIERDAYDREQYDRKEHDAGSELDNFRARLVVRCAVGEDGLPLFTPADAGELGKQDAAVIRRLFDAASRLNGMDGDDKAAKN